MQGMLGTSSVAKGMLAKESDGSTQSPQIRSMVRNREVDDI